MEVYSDKTAMKIEHFHPIGSLVIKDLVDRAKAKAKTFFSRPRPRPRT